MNRWSAWICLSIFTLYCSVAWAQAEPELPPEPEPELPSESENPSTEAELPPAPEPEQPSTEPEPPVPAPDEADMSEARERMRRGEALFVAGNFDAALVEFQRAFELAGDHPNRYLVLYNIGQCHELSFRSDEALRAYREYLRLGGEAAQDREMVEDHLSELEALLATLHVELDVEEAELWVDGRDLGAAPASVRIPGGVHLVEVRARGYESARRQVRLPSGGEETLEISLERLPEQFSGIHPAWFWSSLAMTGAALVAGAAMGIGAFSTHNEVRRRLDDDEEQWEVTQSDLDRIEQLALGADLLFGASLLFAVGTLVFGLLTDWDDDQGEAGAALTLAAGSDGAGLALGGRF